MNKKHYFNYFNINLNFTINYFNNISFHKTFSVYNISEDVTPPKLNFITNQRYSNSTVFISWNYNEPAISNCTLTTPNDVFYVNCSGDSWKGSSLAEGQYSIAVYGTDDSGNTGLSGVYRWTVGM